MLCVKPDLHSKPVHTANTTTMTGKATSQMNSMMGFRWDGVAFTMKNTGSQEPQPSNPHFCSKHTNNQQPKLH